ncbi:MAG TPA: DUF2087 domain-containing protein [Acidimicrobiales bacterium]
MSLGNQEYSAAVAAHAYRTWVRDGRLVGFPRKRSRRLPLLDLVAQDFEPGRSYSGGEVERILRRWHNDTAALRRYLVDEGFLGRFADGSRWWRCGGTVGLEMDIGVTPRSGG